MKIKLYVVHGSHPCGAAMKALELKGLPFGVVELPPVLHVPVQKLLFGRRTVPAMTLDGQKISGSGAIMRRLDELVPEPPLFPIDPESRARVEAAERWGDQVLQPIGRELIWPAMVANPDAAPSYSRHSRLPLPDAALRAMIPALGRAAQRVNQTGADVASRVLAALPDQLDRVDGLIADGTIGDAEHPNAADLQIASTVRLLLTIGDVLPLIEGRPCAALATTMWPIWDGFVPAGAIRAA